PSGLNIYRGGRLNRSGRRLVSSTADRYGPEVITIFGGRMTHAVRRATAADADALTHILATGFRVDPPLVWILPDPAERDRLSPPFFRPSVDLVLENGIANIAEDYSGGSLWLDVDVTAHDDSDPAEFRQLFVDGIGAANAERFFILDDLFSAGHPTA